MIKNASRIWGFHDTQSESSFDPVVGLILGALASELAKVSIDIHTVEARLLERLVELLTPEPITGPFPAHAIARAKSIDPVFEITPNYQFYINKRYLKPGEFSAQEKSVFFTPAGKYKLFNGDLRYFIAGSKLFRYDGELEKEMIAIGRSTASLQPSEFWIGIEMDENVEFIDGLSIYFDLRNEAFEEAFYDSLNKAKWSLNYKEVKFYQGMGNNTYNPENLKDLLLQELEITCKVNSHINRFYKNKFQSLLNKKISTKKSGEYLFPEEFNRVFSPEDLDKIEGNITWIKVEFPQIMPVEVFDDLFCSINCFPVLNRHLNEFTQSSRDFINIIPILTDEVFFSMKRVSNSEGKLFSEKSFSGIGDIDEGSFIVRSGGVGRFDSRNAAEMVSYLLELLRDESAAFSIIGTDMITSDLKELKQTLTRLEQRLEQSNVVKKDLPYLLLKAHPHNDTLFIEYWTTNGKFGNKIKGGENLFVYDGSGLWPDGVKMVSNSVGGRENMDSEERINAYRKALLSHGRVVTKEDIKALCYEHMGKLLEKVEVKKGLQTGQSTDNGFSPTHDIILTLKNLPEEIDESEINHLKKDLLIKLEEQSVSVLPFRCFINRN